MYNNRDKSHAIRQLVLNLGDVKKTCADTGISERTMQRWKEELKTDYNIIHWGTSSKSAIIQQRYERIRDKMLDQIERLLERMVYDEANAPDYAMAATRLTDRITKIESLLNVQGQYEIAINIAKQNEVDRATDNLSIQDDP